MQGRQLGSLILTLVCCHAAASNVVWRQPLAEEVKWSQLTSTGTLIVAGKRSLVHVDTGSGKSLWRRDDLGALAPFNVRLVPGLPYVVISEHVGKLPPKSQLTVLDFETGETIWETGITIGSNLGGYPIPERALAIFVREITGAKGIKPGTYVSAHKLETGEEIWSLRIGGVGALPLHASDDSGFLSNRDLGGHPSPLLVGDYFILPAGDLYAFDIAKGEQVWRFKLKGGHPSLKRTYASPVLADGVLYATGKNRVYALSPVTGEELWSAKIGNAAMPQLEIVGDLLVGRLGGTFSDGKKLTQLKPFGAFVLQRDDGATRWIWKKGKNSITNFEVMTSRAEVVLADKSKLYALDLNAEKKPKVVYELKLEFKRSMGAADVAAKSLGAVGGFLGGGLAGAAKGLGGGSDRSDPPLEVDRLGDLLIVRGESHVLAHDLATRRNTWSIEFAPPGMNSFALIAMGAVTATAALGQLARPTSMYGSTMDNSVLGSITRMTGAFERAVGERFAASEESERLAFFLTNQEQGLELVGINLRDGSEVGSIPMADKEPQFMVDAIGRRVYYFNTGGAELVAYSF
jgi:outer membrane protein assembly factor BamB